MQDKDPGGPSGAPPREETEAPTGRVLSSAGGLARVALPGPVALGQAVDVDGGLGVVLQYDRRGAVVALLGEGSARAGAPVAPRGTLSSRAPAEGAGGAEFLAVRDLLTASAGAGSVLELPAMPPPPRRRPVRRHLPSGLAAVDALLPLGEGQRVGLVGPPGTGKSAAARMLMQSLPSDAVCVYAAQKPLSYLKAHLGSCGAGGAPLRVVYADPSRDPVGARYLAPLCALQLASRLRATHRHVLLVLDDLVAFTQAAAEIPVPPVGAPQVLASALDSAGTVAGDGGERALSVVALLDLEPEEEQPPTLRALWRGAEPALDVRLAFSGALAARGVLPAVDPDCLLASGFAPSYHPPLLRQLRGELLDALRRSRDLVAKLELARPLGLHVEMQEEEELSSSQVARALFAHKEPRPLPELAVVLVAALVYHFPVSRPPPPSAVAGLQRALIDTVQTMYPALWDLLSRGDSLSEAEAAVAIRDLAEVLLAHRLDFGLTRPSH